MTYGPSGGAGAGALARDGRPTPAGRVAGLAPNSGVRAAGLLHRPPAPPAPRKEFVFLSLEDETGISTSSSTPDLRGEPPPHPWPARSGRGRPPGEADGVTSLKAIVLGHPRAGNYQIQCTTFTDPHGNGCHGYPLTPPANPCDERPRCSKPSFRSRRHPGRHSAKRSSDVAQGTLAALGLHSPTRRRSRKGSGCRFPSRWAADRYRPTGPRTRSRSTACSGARTSRSDSRAPLPGVREGLLELKRADSAWRWSPARRRTGRTPRWPPRSEDLWKRPSSATPARESQAGADIALLALEKLRVRPADAITSATSTTTWKWRGERASGRSPSRTALCRSPGCAPLLRHGRTLRSRGRAHRAGLVNVESP